MRLDNRTRWRTDDLRKLVAACLRAHDVPSTGLRVEVIYGRRGKDYTGASGCAALGGWQGNKHFQWGRKDFRHGKYMQLVLARPENIVVLEDAWIERWLLQAARVVDHEVGHLRGLNHRDMSEALYRCTQAVPWAEGLTLRPAPEPDAAEVEAKKAAARADHEAHARKMYELALTRLKRATTIAKKWKRRVAAYERTALR